jgi:hypothetical protein
MIDVRYLKFLLLASAVCGFFVTYMWIRGASIDVAAVVSSFAFGAAFTSLVTVRLPVFRQYFSASTREEISKYRGRANEKAALVMASLVAGVIIGAALISLKVRDVVAPAFTGAAAAGVISLYHRKKR